MTKTLSALSEILDLRMLKQIKNLHIILEKHMTASILLNLKRIIHLLELFRNNFELASLFRYVETYRLKHWLYSQ